MTYQDVLSVVYVHVSEFDFCVVLSNASYDCLSSAELSYSLKKVKMLSSSDLSPWRYQEKEVVFLAETVTDRGQGSILLVLCPKNV